MKTLLVTLMSLSVVPAFAAPATQASPTMQTAQPLKSAAKPAAAQATVAEKNAELGKLVKPDLQLTDATGKTHKISDFKGKTVVLEWLNYGCPFVRKHYDAKNMQVLQTQAKKDGMVWLSVVSSAKGEQGYNEPAKMIEVNKKEGNNATATILDPTGVVGKYFEAKVTPHMYIIDPTGKLVYRGGIDSKKSTEVADVNAAGVTKYVQLALADVKAGREIPKERASTDAYGCGVKYAK